MRKSFGIGALALVLALAATQGCGGNPLIGTWRLDFRALLTPAQQMYVTEAYSDMTFNGDGTLVVDSRSVATNTAPLLASCVIAGHATGLTWNAMMNAGVNSVTVGGSPMGTQSRSMCMDPSMNVATMPIDPGTMAVMGSFNYTIMGSTLTMTTNSGMGTTTLTLTRR